MSERRNPRISELKRPQQARSTALVEAVLDAAVQVLTREGAARFTTARVAEAAGVSVGSLYQYFPNKAAILFRLQSDEWRRTTALLRQILEDQRTSPTDRLSTLVHAFVRSEREEAAVRQALADAAPLYRDAPEARDAKAEGFAVLRRFVDEALPDAPENTRALAAELIGMTMGAVGKLLSETTRSNAELASAADGLADMLSAYLSRLSRSESGSDFG